MNNKDYLFSEVPAYITVHLGRADEEGENVNLSFPDYIKGVSSYYFTPDIPSEALYALVYAQISRSLFRITQKEYRKAGYGFDITNDPEADLAYIPDGVVYDRVNGIVDSIFNGYIVKEGEFTPLNAEICYSGARCIGFALDTAIDLAENGKNFGEILEYFFGKDIFIVKNLPVTGLRNPFLLDYPLYRGQRGSAVSGLQIALNRVGANYGGIPYVEPADGYFDEDTEEAVKAFQRIFSLPVSGSVEKDTYYKLLYVLDGIYRLNYLVLMSKELENENTNLRAPLKYGDVGNSVKLLQYYLLFVSAFENRVAPPQIVGVYGEKTYQSVTDFQRIFGFEPDGVVTEEVWTFLKGVKENLYSFLPPSAFSKTAVPYGGSMLVLGSVGANVAYLQEYLNKVASVYPKLAEINVTGEYDKTTESAVKAFQGVFGINPTGVVTSTTWNILSEVYNAILSGENLK